MSRVTVTADDYGLTRGNTDSILEAADRGALTRVSLLPNGLAFDYAATEYKKRSGRLTLAVHLNLTEGKPLSAPSEIPRLVDSRGYFKYSPISLLLATLFRGSGAPVCGDIRRELKAQLERIRSIGAPFSADGHQHVHMIPAVFRELLALAPEYRIRSVRMPHEPVGIIRTLLVHPMRSLQVMALNYLTIRNMMRAREKLPHNDWFIGVLHSGSLTESRIRTYLSHVPENGELEIGTHPGTALLGELENWRGDRQWHYSPNRREERGMLLSESFKDLLASARGEVHHVSRVARFVIAGSLAAMVHLGILFVLTEYAGVWYLLSATVGWCVAFVVSFTLQKFFTFDDRSALHGRQAYRYLTLQLVNLLLNTLGLYALTSLGVWYMLSQFLVLLLLAAGSYLISSRLIFTAQR